MKYLLDTNVISETVKKSPNKGVVEFMQTIPLDYMYLSTLTIGEIRKGIENITKNSVQKQKLMYWLEYDLINNFSTRLLSIDLEVANKWGFIVGKFKNPIPAIDSLIAATALTHNLILVTRNTKDYDKFGLEIINPWLSSRPLS